MHLRRILNLSFFALIIPLLAWFSGRAASPYQDRVHQQATQSPSPSPTYDPLSIPVLPKNPTEFDRGKNLYYYHCMPCHGDVGQGLTDAWRMVWEEDHRNCWGRGCHGGRLKDEGFPVPTVVPAIIAPTGLLAKYPDLESLVSYLQETHPPQRPGKLADAEYHALAVFLWLSNHKPLPAESASSPTSQNSPAISITPTTSPTASTPQVTPTGSPVLVKPTSSQSPASTSTTCLRFIPLAAIICLILLIIVLYVIRRLLNSQSR
jgi:hypothetical protein